MYGYCIATTADGQRCWQNATIHHPRQRGMLCERCYRQFLTEQVAILLEKGSLRYPRDDRALVRWASRELERIAKIDMLEALRVVERAVAERATPSR
ncbi:MAG: hypothetical protein NZ518_11065 [Dehalococcoidia bacterium]|nr:hypothetical protein [Dehalococcoidia bacterium]